MDGERGHGKVNQGSTEMMSTEQASVTKWRQEKSRGGSECDVAKRDLWKEEIRERKGGWRGVGGGEYVMKERRAFGDCAAFVERGGRNRRWVRFPCASTKHFTDTPQPLKSIGA